MGAQVHGFALPPPTTPNLFSLAGIEPRLASHTLGNVCDADAVRAALLQAQPDIVIHMAAQAIVLTSYEQPLETLNTNIMGTAHVLDAVRACPSVRVALMVTSDKCYENRETPVPYTEDQRLGGHDPYSASKAAAELVTASYRNSFFSAPKAAAIATARAGNVIGGGDWARHRLVPDILGAIVAGRQPDIRNPASVRPWQHVLEPLSGYLRLCEALWHDGPAFAGAWNFGPPPAPVYSVGEVTDMLLRLWQGQQGWTPADPQAHEAVMLQLDITKAKAGLGWHPRWNIEEALQAIVSWHRTYLESGDIVAVMKEQIAQYELTQPVTLLETA